MIIVDIALATIWVAGQCHNALIGTKTPKGEYNLMHVMTEDPGYGGDVLVFKDTPEKYFAIHRVWLLKPAQKREERLKSDDPKYRVITAGCINVDPKVYAELVDCCRAEKLIVK